MFPPSPFPGLMRLMRLLVSVGALSRFTSSDDWAVCDGDVGVVRHERASASSALGERAQLLRRAAAVTGRYDGGDGGRRHDGGGDGERSGLGLAADHGGAAPIVWLRLPKAGSTMVMGVLHRLSIATGRSVTCTAAANTTQRTGVTRRQPPRPADGGPQSPPPIPLIERCMHVRPGPFPMPPFPMPPVVSMPTPPPPVYVLVAREPTARLVSAFAYYCLPRTDSDSVRKMPTSERAATSAAAAARLVAPERDGRRDLAVKPTTRAATATAREGGSMYLSPPESRNNRMPEVRSCDEMGKAGAKKQHTLERGLLDRMEWALLGFIWRSKQLRIDFTSSSSTYLPVHHLWVVSVETAFRGFICGSFPVARGSHISLLVTDRHLSLQLSVTTTATPPRVEPRRRPRRARRPQPLTTFRMRVLLLALTSVTRSGQATRSLHATSSLGACFSSPRAPTSAAREAAAGEGATTRVATAARAARAASTMTTTKLLLWPTR